MTGRGDLLAAVLVLGAWGAFRYRTRRVSATAGGIVGPGGRPRPGLTGLLASVVLFAGALLAKESAAILPALILAGAWAAGKGRRRGAAGRVGDHGWLLLILAAYAAARVAVLGGVMEPGLPDPLDNPLAGQGLAGRLVGAPVAWLHAARLLVFPWDLSPDYSGGALPIPHGPAAVAGWAVALALAAGWIAAARRGGGPFLGLSILLVGYLPAANLLFVAPVLLAERLLYVPSLGFALLLAWGASRVAGPAAAPAPRRRVLGIACLLVLAVSLGARTWVHHRVYRDDLSVWSAATRSRPGSAKAWYNLGNVWIRRDHPGKAAAAYRRAVEAAPDLAIAWSNLGVARSRADDPTGAAEAFRRALDLDPGLAQAHGGLGSLALRRGELSVARRHLRLSLDLDPDQPDAALLRSLLERIESLESPGD